MQSAASKPPAEMRAPTYRTMIVKDTSTGRCTMRFYFHHSRSHKTPRSGLGRNYRRWPVPGLNCGLERIGAMVVSAIVITIELAGCASYMESPEISPDHWAPPAMTREWTPPPAMRIAGERAPGASQTSGGGAIRRGAPLRLPDLVATALSNNPNTRAVWEAAKIAAAEYGKAKAPYYPSVGVLSENGYVRDVAQVPIHWGVLKRWQSRSVLGLTYILLDFGRRDAAAESARARLIAANYSFNRQIQRVVFEVERAYYGLDAARASVDAAKAIVAYATTDRIAAQQRRRAGLATEPQLLLAIEREAQATYDLENARAMVSDAQAELAVALGINADELAEVEGLANIPVPPNLGDQVEELIATACAQRPDLSARIAEMNSRRADVALARAQFYPVVNFGTYYGDEGFSYGISHDHTYFNANTPLYGGITTIKWDLFTGFSRFNQVRATEAAEREAAAEVKSLQVDVVASVWRAYFDFRAAQKKYRYAQALMAASESSYKSNYQTYRMGLSTIIDLLTAERDLANARYTEIRSKAELLMTAAAVAYATGVMPSSAQSKP
jgi:outer membrane protein